MGVAEIMAITDAVIIAASLIKDLNWSELTPEEVAAIKDRRAKLEQVSDLLAGQLQGLLDQYGTKPE